MGKVLGDTFTKDGADSFEVGFGSSIRFQHDLQRQGGVLRDLFPTFYMLAMDRNVTSADYCQRVDVTIVWKTFSSVMLSWMSLFQ